MTSLEEEKSQLDIDLKRIELEEKRSKIKSFFSSSVFFSALITVNVALAAAFVSWINTKSQLAIEEKKLALENQKFVFSQLEKAVQAGDLDSARKMLRFLIDVGIMNDPTGTLRKRLQEPGPSLPALPQSK
jgi:hypothetical protein